ncbi:hypothetical protein [Saccharothrix variisporea]|uniref:hypothetical protein n=1 Tax=Saccharothrix variisporea TaxID=543527 RepID=UPI0014776852|nr:hypothetical protein [Saccharothrix variisporea]
MQSADPEPVAVTRGLTGAVHRHSCADPDFAAREDAEDAGQTVLVRAADPEWSDHSDG